MSITPFNRLEMAGQPLTLTCSASIQERIRGIPVLTWTKEDTSLSSDVVSAPPVLSFPSLRTSHAGRYTCTARLSIPEAGVDVSGNSRTNVSIQCIHFHCHCTYVEVLLCCSCMQLSLHLPSSLDLHGTPVSSKVWTSSSPVASLWVMWWTLQSQYRESGIGMGQS